MAEKTPATSAATAGFVPPQGVWTGAVSAITDDLMDDGDGVALASDAGFQTSRFYFADVDTSDTWTSGIKNLQQVAWQGVDATDDMCAPCITNRATGEITFGTSVSAEGWLWVLHGS